MDMEKLQIKIMKLGGAFFVPEIIVNFFAEFKNKGKTLFVVSAVKGVTRLLESIYFIKTQKDLENEYIEDSIDLTISEFLRIHMDIIFELFGLNDCNPTEEKITDLCEELNRTIDNNIEDKNCYYARILKFGELASSIILSDYMSYLGLSNVWFDARDYVITDDNHKNAKIKCINPNFKVFFLSKPILITQGFIGKNIQGEDTVLGYDGSDKSAADFAIEFTKDNDLHVEIIFYKDVQGVLVGNLKDEPSCVLLKEISYFGYRKLWEKNDTGPVRLDSILSLEIKGNGINTIIRSYIDLNNPGTVVHK